MKSKIRRFAIVLGVFLLCAGFHEKAVSVQAAAPKATEKVAKKTWKSCWVKKNGAYYYYNSRGKLLKNCFYKINGSLYQFDKTGKRISTKAQSHTFWYTFDKKTGKNTSIYTYLKIEELVGKDTSMSLIGSKNTRLGSTNKYTRSQFLISLKNAKIYDQNGKRISYASLREGDEIKVFTKDSYIRESAPAQFGPITKVRVIKRTPQMVLE